MLTWGVAPLVLGYRFVIWVCIVFLVEIIIDPSRTCSTKDFSVNIIPIRGWIKSPPAIPIIPSNTLTVQKTVVAHVGQNS